MNKFDQRIKELEENILTKIGKGIGDAGRALKKQAKDTVSGAIKTGANIVGGVANVAGGIATLDKDRIEKGLDKSIGTIGRGVEGTIQNTVNSVKSSGKALTAGKPVQAALHAYSAVPTPVSTSRQFIRSASKKDTERNS